MRVLSNVLLLGVVISLPALLFAPLQATPLQANAAPTLNPIANMTVSEGMTADQTITATDPDGDPLTYSRTSGPGFMMVTPLTPAASGNVHLKPTYSDAGIYQASASVSDGSTSDTKSFQITVNNVNQGPIIGAIPDMTVNEGVTADKSITATDPDGDALFFSKVAGPTFVTVTTTSGGTGTGTGNVHLAPGFQEASCATPLVTSTVTVRATDSGNPSMSSDKSFSVTVRDAACQATISRCPSSPPVNLTSNSSTCVYVEPVAACFNASDISAPTVVMKYLSNSIAAASVAPPGDDCPGNSVPDAKACFDKAALITLFATLAAGTTTTVTVTVEGSTTAGCHFQGTITFDVKKP